MKNNMVNVLTPMYLKALKDMGVIDKIIGNSRMCKECGKEFHSDRAGHYLCYVCFNKMRHNSGGKR